MRDFRDYWDTEKLGAQRRMRGNKSLRVCPMVNNEAGSIHLEGSQNKQLPDEMLGSLCSQSEWLLNKTLLGNRYERLVKELYGKKLRAKFLSSQIKRVCAGVTQRGRERERRAEKLRFSGWKCSTIKIQPTIHLNLFQWSPGTMLGLWQLLEGSGV